ncbi:hypothetical protein FRC10_000495 [Ceratobasidium sp. 414]|nr:hypothetical protein FRC10_000495 [Ceratobasidium sp. 414]
MPPLRAESSTVSLPPRERALAKRCAKAIKLGLPPSSASKSPAKGIRKRRKVPAPPPTLATTRKRRGAEVAYIDQPDGYHIKHVVRHPETLRPPPSVPYLPGEEDILRSDVESDDGDVELNDGDMTMHKLTHVPYPADFDIAAEVEETPTEPDTNLVDYNAEGEDEDEDVNMEASETYTSAMDLPQAMGISHVASSPMLIPNS